MIIFVRGQINVGLRHFYFIADSHINSEDANEYHGTV